MARLSILLLLVLALAACGSGDGTSEGNTQVVQDAGATAPLPDFDLERIGGGRVRLSELRGKIVVVDFWDTWCPPCRLAMPHLQELSVERADDVVVVGVAVGRNGKQAVADFVAKYGLTFPVVLLDDRQEAVRAFVPHGGVASLPTTFVIDAEGVVRKQIVGFNPQEAGVYEAAIREITGA